MTLAELIAEKTKVQEAIDNVLEAGQEFQTREGRVKQVSIDSLYERMSIIDAAIESRGGGDTTDTVLLKYERG